MGGNAAAEALRPALSRGWDPRRAARNTFKLWPARRGWPQTRRVGWGRGPQPTRLGPGQKARGGAGPTRWILSCATSAASPRLQSSSIGTGHHRAARSLETQYPARAAGWRASGTAGGRQSPHDPEQHADADLDCRWPPSLPPPGRHGRGAAGETLDGHRASRRGRGGGHGAPGAALSRARPQRRAAGRCKPATPAQGLGAASFQRLDAQDHRGAAGGSGPTCPTWTRTRPSLQQGCSSTWWSTAARRDGHEPRRRACLTLGARGPRCSTRATWR